MDEPEIYDQSKFTPVVRLKFQWTDLLQTQEFFWQRQQGKYQEYFI